MTFATTEPLTFEMLDERTIRLANAYSVALDAVLEAEGDHVDITSDLLAEMLRSLNRILEENDEEDGIEHRPCTLDELAFLSSVYPIIEEHHGRQIEKTIEEALDAWQTQYPEVETFGELMAVSSRAGRA